MGVCSSSSDKNGGAGDEGARTEALEPLPEEIREEIEKMEEERVRLGGVNHTAASDLPTSQINAEILSCLVEICTMEELLTVNSSLSKTASDPGASGSTKGQDLASREKLQDYLTECQSFRNTLISMVNEWNRGNVSQEREDGEKEQGQDKDQGKGQNKDAQIVKELFELMPQASSLRDRLDADPDIHFISPSTPPIPITASKVLTFHGTLSTLKSSCQIYRWLTELPTSFIYQGCRKGINMPMSDTTALELQGFGFLYDEETATWTKPFWWNLIDADSLITQWCAHERVKRRKESEYARRKIRNPTAGAVVYPS